ncbi:hypothetical protein EYV94_07625 [Puteibacter caeruleilacunae]|nr:hypothetical protein EYV94_07625 [Puteibacter caeruleilacunae]
MTDKNWNEVLIDMIPKYYSAKNPTEYHLAMLETVSLIDDSHSNFIISKEIKKFFGEYYIPIKYYILDNKILITAFNADEEGRKDDLRVGDAILEIDGVSVKELMQLYSKFIPASNAKGKARRSFFLVTGHKKEALVKIERNGKFFEKTIHRCEVAKMKPAKHSNKKNIKWKKLNTNVAYVNLKHIKYKDTKQMLDSVTKCKAIVFDLRYGTRGTAVMGLIALRLFPEKKVFAKIIAPDLTYPGKYYLTDEKNKGVKNKQFYKGKVLLLVDERTQSHNEYFTMCLQQAPNAITIGTQTAGADGNISVFDLCGGFRTTMTGTGIFYPDGTVTQRKGVKIDINVEPTIEGIKEGRDEILEKAIQLLNAK